jgi:hypothetical protein
MVGDSGDQEMTVRADDLPALRPGQYYEVWLLDHDDGTVLPVGVRTPRPLRLTPPRGRRSPPRTSYELWLSAATPR